MKRGWFVVLALSVGLNAGLLYVHFWGGADEKGGRWSQGSPRAGQGELGPRNHPEGPSGFIHDRMGRIGLRVGLSEDQREGMTAVLDEMMPRILALQEIVQDSQGALRREYLKRHVDREMVLQLQRRSGLAQARLDSLVAETMLRAQSKNHHDSTKSRDY